MLQYITDDDYIRLLDAESVPSNFTELAIQSSYIINKSYIVDTPSEEVKFATAKIVQVLSNSGNTKAEIGNLSSTSIEGWSESYKTDEEIDKETNKSISDILSLYLTNTKRRTKGVILCE